MCTGSSCRVALSAVCLWGLSLAAAAHAQAPQPAPQLPTTVQLPTFRFFTVNTTVSVPDRGSAYLGGLSGARTGSSTRGLGPLRGRSFGGDRTAGGVSVHATVIDHAELDRAVLAEAARGRVHKASEDTTAADFVSAHIVSAHIVSAHVVSAHPGRQASARESREEAIALTRACERR